MSDSELSEGAFEVLVNGEPWALAPGTTVDALVTRAGIERRGVAVAVDGQVVPRSAWRTSTLGRGVQVEIVSAAAGG